MSPKTKTIDKNLQKRITKFLNVWGDVIKNNRASFPTTYNLTIDTPKQYFEKWMEAKNNLVKQIENAKKIAKKEDRKVKPKDNKKLTEKQIFYNRAINLGWTDTYNNSTIYSLKIYIENNLDSSLREKRKQEFDNLKDHSKDEVSEDSYTSRKKSIRNKLNKILKSKTKKREIEIEETYIIYQELYGQEISDEQYDSFTKKKPLCLQMSGKRYKCETKEFDLEVSTTVNLENVYNNLPHIIQVFNKEKMFTSEMIEFLEDINKEYVTEDTLSTLYKVIQSMSSTLTFIKITNISKDISSDPVPDEYSSKTVSKRKKYDSDNSQFICSDYTKYSYCYDSSKKQLDDLFVNEHNMSKMQRACVIDICMTLKDSWDNYQNKHICEKNRQLLTPEYLIKLFDLSDENDYGVSIEQAIERFFKPNRLQLKVYDNCRNLIHEHIPLKKHSHIRMTTNAISYGDHLFYSNNNINSLSKLTSSKDDEWILNPSCMFYIPQEKKVSKSKSKKTLPKITRFIKNVEDIVTLDFTSPTRYTIITETPIEHLLYYLVHKMKYIPMITKTSCEIISSITIRPGESEVVFKNPQENRVLGALEFKDEEQYMRYASSYDEFYKTLICKEHLSYYANINEEYSWIKTAKEFSAKPLIGVISKDVKPNRAYDKCKFYTSIVDMLSYVPVIGAFDNWRVYDESISSTINPKMYYIIERTVDIPNNQTSLYALIKDTITIYPGFLLERFIKEVGPFIKITHYSTISNTSDSKIKSIEKAIKKVYDDPILTSLQKKCICNFVIGHTEKVQNKDSKACIFTDRYEAIEYGAKVAASVYPIIQNYEDKVVFNMDNDEDSIIHPLLKNNSTNQDMYIVVKKEQNDLVSGLYPLKITIYAVARFEMYELHKRIEQEGGIVHSYRTDCIYFYSDKIIHIVPIELDGSYENIGKVTLKHLTDDDKLPVNKIRDNSIVKSKQQIDDDNDEESITEIKKTKKEVIPYIQKQINYTTLPNEHLWKSDPVKYIQGFIDQINLWKGKRIIITGLTAGTGKTFLAKAFFMTLKEEIFKVSAPTNKRCAELRKDFKTNVITIHKLVGIRMDDSNESEKLNETETKSNHLLKEVEYLFIDEIYMLGTKNLARLHRLFDNYPNLTVIASGDVKQQRMSDINNITDQNTYYEDSINSFFNHGIHLKINKRFVLDVDRDNYKIISDTLERGDRLSFLNYVSTFNSLDAMYNIVFNENNFNAKLICYFQDVRTFLNESIHSAVIERKNIKTKSFGSYRLFPGLELTMNSSLNLREKNGGSRNFYTHEKVQIYKMDDKFVYIRAADQDIDIESDEDIIIDNSIYKVPIILFDTLDKFSYSYCDTCMSTQGDTYDKPILIFDSKNVLMSSSSIYTTIGRATMLKDVHIYTGFNLGKTSAESNYLNLLINRVRSHRDVDIAANRKFEEADYIDEYWIDETLELQKEKCHFCNCKLSKDSKAKSNSFSVDRLNDVFAHTKSNCVISCRKCNTSRVSERTKNIKL